mgnify:CR=1 FL=1
MTDVENIPMWVYEWYKSNKIFNETVERFENKKDSHTRTEYDVAEVLLKIGVDKEIKKRSAPKAEKMCNKCKKVVCVNSARRLCTFEYNGTLCEGILTLVKRPPKETKRKPPRCTKKCMVCEKLFFDIPTATSKCTCGEKLSILT